MGKLRENQSTKSYQESEMYCKCGHCPKDLPEMSSIVLMQMLHRQIEGFYLLNHTDVRIVVTSWVRCWLHNKHEGGSDESRHQMQFGGDAADFKVYVRTRISKKHGVKRWEKVNPIHIHSMLCDMFPNSMGFGLYINRNHADCRKIKARWEVK